MADKFLYQTVHICDGEVTLIEMDNKRTKLEGNLLWTVYLGLAGQKGWELVSKNHLGGLYYEATLKKRVE